MNMNFDSVYGKENKWNMIRWMTLLILDLGDVTPHCVTFIEIWMLALAEDLDRNAEITTYMEYDVQTAK